MGRRVRRLVNAENVRVAKASGWEFRERKFLAEKRNIVGSKSDCSFSIERLNRFSNVKRIPASRGWRLRMSYFAPTPRAVPDSLLSPDEVMAWRG